MANFASFWKKKFFRKKIKKIDWKKKKKSCKHCEKSVTPGETSVKTGEKQSQQVKIDQNNHWSIGTDSVNCCDIVSQNLAEKWTLDGSEEKKTRDSASFEEMVSRLLPRGDEDLEETPKWMMVLFFDQGLSARLWKKLQAMPYHEYMPVITNDGANCSLFANKQNPAVPRTLRRAEAQWAHCKSTRVVTTLALVSTLLSSYYHSHLFLSDPRPFGRQISCSPISIHHNTAS